MNKVLRFAGASVVALGIMISASACSGSVDISPTGGSFSAGPAKQTDSSSPSVDPRSAAAAKKTMDGFFAQIGADLPNHVDDGNSAAPMTEEEENKVFREDFADSIAYLNPGSFTTEQERLLIGSFAEVLYGSDAHNSYEAKESGFKISGDTATITTDQFVLVTPGKAQDDPTDADKPETFTLKFVDGKWLIAGFTAL